MKSLGAVGAPLTWDPDAPADLGQGADAALTWRLGVDIMPLKCGQSTRPSALLDGRGRMRRSMNTAVVAGIFC